MIFDKIRETASVFLAYFARWAVLVFLTRRWSLNSHLLLSNFEDVILLKRRVRSTHTLVAAVIGVAISGSIASLRGIKFHKAYE